jgi:hypothetical protein
MPRDVLVLIHRAGLVCPGPGVSERDVATTISADRVKLETA